MRTTYTAGSFDLYHAGHVQFLRQCALLGDVVVALNTDEFLLDYKGAWPAIPYAERRTVLSACRHVSSVIPQDSYDLRPQLEMVRPRYLVIGSDWARKDYYAQIGADQDWLDDHEISLVYVPYSKVTSTTQIRERLACV